MNTQQAPSTLFNRPVYIVDGSRTPLLKARMEPGPFSAADLAVYTCQMLLARQNFAPTDLDEVVCGCVMPSPDEANIARIIALRLGCGNKVPGWTVQRNCGSGLQAIDSAALAIANGEHDLVLAGGTEAMSHAPVLLRPEFLHWLAKWKTCRGFNQRLQALTKFRPHMLLPILGLLRGLNDPLVGLSMGQTAEQLAYRFQITREAADQFALQSHQRLASAQTENHLTEITTLYTRNSVESRYFDHDDGVRPDTSLEKLAILPPIFDKKFGQVTAGNSSQVTDGAAFLILASADAVKKYHLPVLARIKGCHWAGVSPMEMGLGPVHAVPPLLSAQGLASHNIDVWEINEAFAAQVLACLAAWESTDYCRQTLGLTHAFGRIDLNRLNIDGGAIAVGHPIGASGARIVLRLAHILKRKQAQFGVAALCIGGGQGGAMLIENIARETI